jgi:hypothetical protein
MADLVPAVARNAFKRSAPGIFQLLEAWPGIVGPALATVTMPRSLTQGTLAISCSGPVAMELQHFSTELIQRINQYAGSTIVRRLRLLQTTSVQPLATPKRSTPRALRTIEAVSSMPDGPLRDALMGLGNALLDG